MKTIGLIRHYKVDQSRPKKKWMTSTEFDNWVLEYDHCDDKNGNLYKFSKE